MTAGAGIDPMLVWANMTMKTWPERYYMIYLAFDDLPVAAEAMASIQGTYGCAIIDQGGVSVTAEESLTAQIEQRCNPLGKFGPFRMVSTDGELPFNVIGFLRPLLEVLNSNGVKAGPQCSADFDHLFIYEDKLETAQALIASFIAAAAQAAAP